MVTCRSELVDVEFIKGWEGRFVKAMKTPDVRQSHCIRCQKKLMRHNTKQWNSNTECDGCAGSGVIY